jgi:hypothetical protein
MRVCRLQQVKKMVLNEGLMRLLFNNYHNFLNATKKEVGEHKNSFFSLLQIVCFIKLFPLYFEILEEVKNTITASEWRQFKDS